MDSVPAGTAKKFCPGCGGTFDIGEFYKNKAKYDGRSAVCKTCTGKAVRRSNAKRRAAMGDDAWKEMLRERTRRSRANLDPAKNKRLQIHVRQYAQAGAVLRERHRSEFDEILADIRARAEAEAPQESETA